MKKIILVLLSLIFTSSLIGCSNADASNKITISKENKSKLHMEVDYKISNLKNEDYTLKIYTKEYKKGKIINDENFAQTEMTISDISSINVEVCENDGNLEITTGDSFLSFPLNFYDNNMIFSSIDNSKEIDLNKEYPIAVYSNGSKVKSVNINDFKNKLQLGNNDYDLVVYLKLTK